MPSAATGLPPLEELRSIAAASGRTVAEVEAEARRDGAELGSKRGRVGTWLFAALSRFVRRRGYPREPIHDLDELERVREVTRRGGAVFLVSHKTYLDFFVLYEFFNAQGLLPPRIFGGANMAFAGFGALARRAGGIFIRRQFRGDRVYTAVLRQAIADLLAQRECFMWAIEGTRSRTGKLLIPRLGLLHYVSDAARLRQGEPVCFVPVSVVYDRIPDVADLTAQDHGGRKSSESLAWFVRYLRALGGDFGDIHVRFGDVLALGDTPDAPDLDEAGGADERVDVEVQKLAFEACFRINEITPGTDTSLVLLSLLCRGRCSDLQLERDAAALRGDIAARHPDAPERRPSREVRADPAGCAAALTALGVLTAEKQEHGHSYAIRPSALSTAIYYGNTAAHHFVLPAFVELALARLAAKGVDVGPDDVIAVALAQRELFKFEFFFARKDVFRARLIGEAGRLGLAAAPAERWPASAVWAALSGKRIRVAVGVLAPYLSAYRAVAEFMASEPAKRATRDADVIEACLQARSAETEGRPSGSRRRPAAPGWVSRAKRAAPEGACDYCMPSSAAGFRRRRKKGSETPLFHPGLSRALLANGLRVARARKLLPRDGPGAAGRRTAFLAELAEIEAALNALHGMN